MSSLFARLLSVVLTAIVAAATNEVFFVALIFEVIWIAHCFVKDGTSRHCIRLFAN
jgi:hypothetical protein